MQISPQGKVGAGTRQRRCVLRDCFFLMFLHNARFLPRRYAQYQAAAALALTDLKETLGADRDIVVMVVGAGRGPLVRRVLAAAESESPSVQSPACCLG